MWKKFSGRGWKKYIGILFILPALAYFGLVYYYPLGTAFFISFFSNVMMPGGGKYTGIANFNAIFSDRLFWASAEHTFLITLYSVPVTVGVGLLVALMLNRIINRTARSVVTLLYFLPLSTSLVAAALIWEWLLNPVYGIVNSALAGVGLPKRGWLTSMSDVLPSIAMINIWQRLGFDILIYLSALQGIPPIYKEAAEIDGASPFSVFRHITLPLLNPTIVMVGIIELIFAFKLFDQVYVTTGGGPANMSRVIIMYLYDKAFTWFDFGKASAVGVLVFLFVLTVSIFQWKVFRRTVEY